MLSWYPKHFKHSQNPFQIQNCFPLPVTEPFTLLPGPAPAKNIGKQWVGGGLPRTRNSEALCFAAKSCTSGIQHRTLAQS